MIRITGAQLLMALSIVYVVISFGIFAGTNAEKVEQGHRDSHHEKDFLHQRAKRYALSRVPLSYQQPRLYDIDGSDDDSYAVDKRYRSNSIQTNPAASHFREVQVRQIRRPSGDDIPNGHSYRNLLQYYGEPSRDNDIDMLGQSAGGNPDGVAPLADEELQALLLLLDGYKLQGNPQQASRTFYTPPAQYFPSEDGPLVGKRETGKRNLGAHRTKAQLEQPMSFENSLSDGGAVFLGQKRSKRIGDSPMKQRSMQSSIRIKKETDPAVEAGLDKLFAGVAAERPESQHSSIPTTAISSSNHQIPPPSSSSIQKKAINWSNYFGIDKRSGNKQSTGLNGQDSKQAVASPSSSTSSSSQGGVPATTTHHKQGESIKKSSDEHVTSTSPSLEGTAGHSGSNEKSDKLKDKKDKKRLENDTEEKPDRKWIIHEFYKNLAMSTNVRKRKRESPNGEAQEEVDKLEKIERKMEEAGDQIIWDALKYTGAHKDAQLSPDELAHVKYEIIHKLGTAYSLEKVREAIEEFRQELTQLKDKQQHY